MFRFILPPLSLVLLLLTSCGAQSSPEREASAKSSATSPILAPSELGGESEDPYFEEPDAIRSPNGPTAITRGVLEDREGTIWLTTWHGIISYDGDTFVNHTYEEDLVRWHAFASLEDSKGNLWFTTIGGGVYRYDGKAFQRFSKANGLPYDRVTYVSEDHAGNIWLGSEGGLSRFDGTSFRHYSTKDGLPDNDVNTIIQVEDGTYWIGVRGTAATFDGTTFTTIKRPDGGTFNNVRSLLEDQNGSIWLGGGDGLWRYDGQNFTQFDDSFVGYLFQDRSNNLWASTDAGGSPNWTLERYPAAALQADAIKTTSLAPEAGMLFGIEEDRAGGIWVGAIGGVVRYNGREFDYFRE